MPGLLDILSTSAILIVAVPPSVGTELFNMDLLLPLRYGVISKTNLMTSGIL